MPLNKFKQIYEISITARVEDSFSSDVLNISDKNYIYYKCTTNKIFQTITYYLYFDDMISQTNFINALPKNLFSYSLLGLVYFDIFPEEVGDFVNG